MHYPEAPVESSLPQLGSQLHASLAQPALVDFLRRSLQIRQPTCSVGLPRRVSPDVARRWLSGPHVSVKLASGAQFDALFCEIALPAEQAVELSDRVLGGGTGRAPLPSKLGLPSAAECGVLAYFAARCVRECGADLRVQDVAQLELPALAGDAVLWPVRLRAGDDIKLDLKLLFPDPARCPRAKVSARLSLTDALREADLQGLEPGDLLTGDGWSLHDTLAGPSGLLDLAVVGSSERVSLSLERNALRLASCDTPREARDTAELIIAELTLEFSQLALLLDGESVPCPALDQGRLVANGRTLARGRLVHFRGQLALEVVDHSMR
jgi:hypothetical protein